MVFAQTAAPVAQVAEADRRIHRQLQPGAEAAAVVSEVVSYAMRMRIYERDGWACVQCGFTQSRDEVEAMIEAARRNDGRLPQAVLTIDHIVPRSRGGRNHAPNLQTLCYECNQRKGNRLPARVVAPTAPRPNDYRVRTGRFVGRVSAGLPFQRPFANLAEMFNAELTS